MSKTEDKAVDEAPCAPEKPARTTKIDTVVAKAGRISKSEGAKIDKKADAVLNKS